MANYPPSPCSSEGTPDSESSSTHSQPAMQPLPQKQAKFKLTPLNRPQKNIDKHDEKNDGYYDEKELLSLARQADDGYQEEKPQPDAAYNNKEAEYQYQDKDKDKGRGQGQGQGQHRDQKEEEYNMYETKNKKYETKNNKNTHHSSKNWGYKDYYHKKDEYDPNSHNKPATPSASPPAHAKKRTNYQNYGKKNYNDSYHRDYASPSNSRLIADKSYKNKAQNQNQSKSRHERYVKNNEQANKYSHQSKAYNQDYRYNASQTNERYNDRSAESYNDPSRYQAQSTKYNTYSIYPQGSPAQQRQSAAPEPAPRPRRNINFDDKKPNYYREQIAVRPQAPKTWICSLCWATNNGNDTFCSKCNTMIPHNDQYLPPTKRREMFAESVQMAANVVLRAAQQQQQQPYAQPYAQIYPTYAPTYNALPLPAPQAQKQQAQNQEDEKQGLQLKASSNQETKTVQPIENKYSAKLAAQRQRAEEQEAKYEPSGDKDKGKDYELMLKLIDKLEKRQSKIDANENKIDGALAALQLQRKEMFENIQSDRDKMETEFKNIEKTMKQQFEAQKMALISLKNYLNDTNKTFEAFHEQTAKTLFVETTETNKNRLQKEVVTKMRDFDKKSSDFQCIQQPTLYYESYLAQRYAQFEEYDEKSDVMGAQAKGNKVKIVFADGVLCGVVPIQPESVEVSLSRSYQPKAKEDNNMNITDNGSDISEASQLSQISAVTSAKFNVFNNVRVMFEYDDIGKFHNKTLNISAHQIVVELKNHKAFSVIIDDPSVRHYEYKQYPNLKIYEGVAKVRSKNKNGWCSYKIIPFKFDEFGNKLPMPGQHGAKPKDNKRP